MLYPTGIGCTIVTEITDVTIHYLIGQAKAGADVLQVFDSWSGLLGPDDFEKFASPYLVRIAMLFPYMHPVILFPKGSNYALHSLSQYKSVSGIGIDWTINPGTARAETGHRVALQGNFDPARLMLPPAEIRKEVHRMISEFGVNGYIANLGHGIMPHIPVDHAKAFVDAVKEYK